MKLKYVFLAGGAHPTPLRGGLARQRDLLQIPPQMRRRRAHSGQGWHDTILAFLFYILLKLHTYKANLLVVTNGALHSLLNSMVILLGHDFSQIVFLALCTTC